MSQLVVEPPQANGNVDAGTGGVPLDIDGEVEEVEHALCGHSAKATTLALPAPFSTSSIPAASLRSACTGEGGCSIIAVSPSSSQRWPLDTSCLEEALELAGRCEVSERQGPGDWCDNPWHQSAKLRPILSFVAQPDFALPARFQQVMDTCVVCLLQAPEGHLQRAFRMVEFLESPDVEPTLRYLEWLEPALREAGPSRESSCRTVLVPQRVRSALSSWPAECALLRQSATALWEALLKQAPEHLRMASEWQQRAGAREAMKAQQTEECLRISQQLEAASSQLENELEASAHDHECPNPEKLVRISQEGLRSINRLASELLSEHREKWAQALKQYEAHGERMNACRAAVGEARRQVRRHEQALGQSLQRFTEFANQLVAWTSVLVPKLRLLEQERDTLRATVDLQSRIPVLEREKIEAEDEQDAAATELRKHRRHASASRQTQTPAGAALEKQLELRAKHAEERVRQLTEQLKQAESQLHDLLEKLPLAIVPEDLDEYANQRAREDLSPEERLALKLAELQETHEVVALQVSEVQAERDRVLAQVEERRADEALRKRIEPDFMCPIMHERMHEPVLAADGHTYERQAIERWLQMHNTSPMTGAPLAHRYLTENFALRHLISSYEAALPKEEHTRKMDDVEEHLEEEEEEEEDWQTGSDEDGESENSDEVASSVDDVTRRSGRGRANSV